MVFIRLVAVALFCISVSFSSNLELKIFTVGQANFTMLVNGGNALVFDCGYGTGCKKEDWVDQSEKFVETKKNMISKWLKGVNKVTIVISHNHIDHRNLLLPLKTLLSELKFSPNSFSGKKSAFINGWDNSVDDLQFDSLGTDVTVNKFIAEGAAFTIHDKCLVLKVTVNNQRSILLTGDASGKACETVVKDDSSVLNNIDVLMLTHHGSARENA
jgi:beta-lactamase superfamily II metal-dependent hydrolase